MELKSCNTHMITWAYHGHINVYLRDTCKVVLKVEIKKLFAYLSCHSQKTSAKCIIDQCIDGDTTYYFQRPELIKLHNDYLKYICFTMTLFYRSQIN